ncbi:hypothetical protein RISK_004272 [Rhodopirellula islandica]|uniref:Uncharacterized protein n=1 Tax=Rhodopirellula islandica TaxID=595434 RepID=A0A0J1BAZ7_RHOIS|nr:hypothetical protein RISK_004272 [Rhodopirellula islandica]
MNSQGVTVQHGTAAQAMLHRIIAVLLRIAMESVGAVEPEAGFPDAFEHEYCFAEHEHECEIRSPHTLTIAGLLVCSVVCCSVPFQPVFFDLEGPPHR